MDRPASKEHAARTANRPMASPGKKPFLLRVEPPVWAEVERLAAELRSVNAQVEYLLREALKVRNGRAARAKPATGGPGR